MQTEAALAAFEETKVLQQLTREDKGISSSAMSVYNKSFNKMADMSVSLLARSIKKVVIPEGDEITDANEIHNFFQNYSKYDFDMIVLNFFVNDFERIVVKKSNFFIKNFYSISYFNKKILKILIKNSLADDYKNFYLKTFEDEKFVKESLNLLKEINEYCKEKKIIFVINYMPELRGIKNYKFNKQIKIMENFAKQNGIKFVNSLNILQNYEDLTLLVTKEDSHYNDKAHLLISKFLKKKLTFE